MMRNIKSWTIVQILDSTTRYFDEHGIGSARLNAERLLASVLSLRRIDLYLQFDRILTPPEIDTYRDLVRRRARNVPLQYILGQTEFMGLPFKVTPDVLIPRPETELIVEKILELHDSSPEAVRSVWDIGTGSGCIAVSLAHYRPGLQVYASDYADEILSVARENSRMNKTEPDIVFIKHDIFSPLPAEIPENIDIIVSNPPYISDEEYLRLNPEILENEPRSALTDSADGLKFYRHIFQLLKSDVHPGYLFLELSGTQHEKVEAEARKAGFPDLQVINDLNEIPRVLKIRI